MSEFEWEGLASKVLPCPVCRDGGEKCGLVSIKYSPVTPWAPPVDYVRCAVCGTVFQSDFTHLDYEVLTGDVTRYTDFSVEQGISIESMSRSLYLAPQAPGAKYLEIGCGYGFSLDYAGVVFGYRCLGLDPSPYARRGAVDLGVDIRHEYLNQELIESERPFDLAMCSEVIEHIPEPLAFIALMFEALAESGSAVVTTPNGALIDPATPDHRLGTILSFWHCVLFTRRSLERALRACGFSSVEVWESEATLHAFASRRKDLPANLHGELDRGQYCVYLAHKWEVADRSSALSCGVGVRLFKELVNAGKYKEAGDLFVELRESLRSRFGIDLDDPLSLPLGGSFEEFGALVPYNIVGILYHRGIWFMNEAKDLVRAEASFAGGVRAGARLLRVCDEVLCYDQETLMLTELSLKHMLLCEARRSPQLARDHLDHLLRGEDSELGEGLLTYIGRDLVMEMGLRLIVDCVMRGEYPTAWSLVSAGDEEFDPADIEEANVPAKLKGDLYFSLGVLLMNYLADYRGAQEMFERAFEGTKGAEEPEMGELAWQALFHKGLSHRMEGELAESRAIAEILESPQGYGPEAPAIDQVLRERVGELR